jgi:hypothetical protein
MFSKWNAKFQFAYETPLAMEVMGIPNAFSYG